MNCPQHRDQEAKAEDARVPRAVWTDSSRPKDRRSAGAAVYRPASPPYTSLSQEQIQRGTQEETGPHLLVPNQVLSRPTCWSAVTFRQQRRHTSEAFDAELAAITRGLKLIAERGGFVVIVISIYLYRERGGGCQL